MFDRSEDVKESSSASSRLVSIDDALFEGGESDTFGRILLVEAMAQTAALFAEGVGRRRSGMLVGLRRVHFHGTPRPGERLVVETSLMQKFGDLVRVEGRVSRSGEPLADGEILISLVGGAGD